MISKRGRYIGSAVWVIARESRYLIAIKSAEADIIGSGIEERSSLWRLILLGAMLRGRCIGSAVEVEVHQWEFFLASSSHDEY